MASGGRPRSKVSAHVCAAPVRASSPPGGGPRDRPAYAPALPVRRHKGGAGRPRRHRARARDGRGAARAAGRPAALAPGGGTGSRLGDCLRVPAVDRQPPGAGHHRRVHPQLPRRRPRDAVGATDATDRPLRGGGTPPFDWRDLGGAVAVGLLCGIGARLFSTALHWLGDRRVTDIPMGLRIVAAGAALALLAYLSNAAADEPLSLGVGYDVIEWASDPGHAQWLVLA